MGSWDKRILVLSKILAVVAMVILVLRIFASYTIENITYWKTYINPKYNYEIKYPPNLFVSEKRDGDGVFFNDPKTGKSILKISTDAGYETGNFGEPDPKAIENIEKIVQENNENLKKYGLNGFMSVQDKITVNGINGAILRWGGNKDWVMQAIFPVTQAYFPYNNRWLMIVLEKGQIDQFKKIISTLKFDK